MRPAVTATARARGRAASTVWTVPPVRTMSAGGSAPPSLRRPDRGDVQPNVVELEPADPVRDPPNKGRPFLRGPPREGRPQDHGRQERLELRSRIERRGGVLEPAMNVAEAGRDELRLRFLRPREVVHGVF